MVLSGWSKFLFVVMLMECLRLEVGYMQMGWVMRAGHLLGSSGGERWMRRSVQRVVSIRSSMT
jgi:hypothetical protein